LFFGTNNREIQSVEVAFFSIYKFTCKKNKIVESKGTTVFRTLFQCKSREVTVHVPTGLKTSTILAGRKSSNITLLGAFSNHIAAVTFAGKEKRFKL
jgi:hypothetical protein